MLVPVVGVIAGGFDDGEREEHWSQWWNRAALGAREHFLGDVVLVRHVRMLGGSARWARCAGIVSSGHRLRASIPGWRPNDRLSALAHRLRPRRTAAPRLGISGRRPSSARI